MRKADTPRTFSGKMACFCITLLSYLVAGVGVAVVGYLVLRGLGPLGRGFFRATPVYGGNTLIQIWFQTVRIFLGAICIALPLGIGAGIYLSEYAPDSRMMHNTIDSIIGLAEVPPIVYGLFGWGAFSLYRGLEQVLTVVLLTSGIWLLPRIVLETYAALQQVPVSYRRESLALGASPWQTTWRAVLPSARRQLAIGILQGMARVSGEVAPIIVIAAEPGLGGDSLTILPYYLYRSIIEFPLGSREAQFAAALLLFATSLFLHLIAMLIEITHVTPVLGTEYQEGGRWW